VVHVSREPALYRPNFFLRVEPLLELFERRECRCGTANPVPAKPMASAAKNSIPWAGRSRSTPGSRDCPGMKKPPARVSPPPFFWTLPLFGGGRL
jgi:hypothetical protein